MGLRVRLRAEYDLSGFTGASRVVLQALQRYGMFLTDSGGLPFWAVAGAEDSRWPVQDLEQIKTVEAERDALLAAAKQERSPAPVAMLTNLKGIGAEFAMVLWSEGLFRHFDK